MKSSFVLQISIITSGSNIHFVTSFSNFVKQARVMTIFARVSNIFSSNRKPMPIPINNEFYFLFSTWTEDK